MNFGQKLRRELVVDIGSSHTVVASNRKPFLLRVPSRIGIANGGPGGAPGAASPAGGGTHPKLVFPVERGRVTDPFAMEELLKGLLKQASGRWGFLALRTTGALLVPPRLEEAETSSLRALLVDVGFGRPLMIEAPFAAVRGCGLSLSRPEGQMVMDFGGGKVYFAVFSLGGLAAWWQDDFGSRDLDVAIAAYISRRYGKTVSLATAEEIKLAVGSVFPTEKPQAVRVAAVETRSGDPAKLSLEDNEIRDVLVDRCEKLILAFQRGFEAVAPELAGDIARNGVTLVGGGAALRGLPAFLRERTGLEFRLAADPFNAAVLGAQHMIHSGGAGGTTA